MTFSVTLPLSLAQFTGELQELFKERIAITAGLTKADSKSVVLSISGGNRRLFASNLAINVTIFMPNESAAVSAVKLITTTALNNNLVAVGLPAATITKAPSYAGTVGMTSQASIRGIFSVPCILVMKVLLFISLRTPS